MSTSWCVTTRTPTGTRGAIAANCNDDDDNVGSGGPALGEDANQYPCLTFLGGTVSLNAVFFSTILLSSRVWSDVASYAFV
jgi:hypothetical protein